MAFQSALQPLMQQFKCIAGASQDATFQRAVNCNRVLFGSQLPCMTFAWHTAAGRRVSRAGGGPCVAGAGQHGGAGRRRRPKVIEVCRAPSGSPSHLGQGQGAGAAKGHRALLMREIADAGDVLMHLMQREMQHRLVPTFVVLPT